MPTRWRARRELVRVARRHRRPQPTLESSARARSAASARAMPCARSAARRRFCPAVIRGSSDPYGSWNTPSASSGAARAARRVRAVLTSWPSKRMRPSLGSISRSTSRPSVLLPLPVSPTRPSVSPRASVKGHVVHRRTLGTRRPEQRAPAAEALAQPATSRSALMPPPRARPAGGTRRDGRPRAARAARGGTPPARSPRSSAARTRSRRAACRVRRACGAIAASRLRPAPRCRGCCGTARFVYGWRGARKRPPRPCRLDHAAGVHHRHAIGLPRHHAG